MTASLLLAATMTFRVWTADDGLPQSSVYAIEQTQDGYLWIATFGGLVRFDGARMTVFDHAEIPELVSNRILALRVDSEGSLWIGTEDGGITRMKDGQFQSFGTAEGLPETFVAGFQEDAQGRLWAAGYSGLVRFDGNRWSVPPEAVPHKGETIDPLIAGIWRSNGGRFIESGGSLVDYVWPAGTNLTTGKYGHHKDPWGDLWSRTGERTLLQLANGKITPVLVLERQHQQGRDPRFAVHKGRSGRLWLILDRALSVFENGSWRTLVTQLPDAVSSPVTLFEDREGSLWIGGSAGLAQAVPTPLRALSPGGPADEQNFYPVAEARDGRIWTGSQAALFVLEQGRFTRPRDIEGFVTALEPEPDGSMLVANGYSVYRVTPDLRRTEIYRGQYVTRDILRDRSGVLWLGTENSLDRVDAVGVRRLGPADGLAGSRVNVLLAGAGDVLWVGCHGGLSRIAGGRIESFTVADGLSSDKIRALHEDDRGSLWIGTYDGGLTRFAAGKLVRIRKRDGLYDDGAFAILDDGRGRFWMSCNRGIYSVPRDQLDAFADGRAKSVTSRPLGRVDGMLSAECNGAFQPAGVRKSDGTLWFPTQRGLVVVDPRELHSNPIPPSVVIEEIASEHRPHPVASTVTLSSSERRLEIAFTAPTFVRPEQARFRYRLEALDDGWADARTTRSARYSHVPPGRYVFRVAASNGDGVWNEAGASFLLVVSPAWWETNWLRGGAALAVVGVVALGFRARIERLKRRRKEQEVFSRRLIASQEAERKRIAGELHDGIGQSLVMIRNRALMNLRHEDDPPRARRQVEEILETTTQAIDETRTIAYNLRPYQIDRLGLAQALESLVEQAGAASEIALTSEIDPLDGVFAPADEIHVYRIVQEAVSNLVRHAGARTGKVTARVSQGGVEIVIEDDGRGFDPGALQARRSGMGLSGIEQRVAILRGRTGVQSAPGRGTRLTVWLPRKGAGA